jgi:Protein of unknown function (DUF742)
VGAEDDDPGPMIGLTGARFSGAPRRKARKHAAGSQSTDAAAPAVQDARAEERPPPEPDQPLVGLTGARFGGAQRQRPKDDSTAPPSGDRASGAQPAESGAPVQRPQPAVAAPAPWNGQEPVEQPSGSSFVRPYVFTGGRTRPQFELPVEALVSVVPSPATRRLGGTHDAVLDLCRDPRSVAEVAALLGVPLGVARVLVGDLAAAGIVAVHRTADAAGPDLTLMERVLSGLRRL